MVVLALMRHGRIAGRAGVRGFFTDRSQSAALILQQKLCGALTPGHFAHNGIGFERYYPYLVLFLTFHRDWRVSEHDASSSYRGFSLSASKRWIHSWLRSACCGASQYDF